MTDLSEKQSQQVRTGRCLCGAKKLMTGARGGMCVNVKCAVCEARYNITPSPFPVDMLEPGLASKGFPNGTTEPAGDVAGVHSEMHPAEPPTLDELYNMKAIAITHSDGTAGAHALLLFREDEKYLYCLGGWSNDTKVIKLDKQVFKKVFPGNST